MLRAPGNGSGYRLIFLHWVLHKNYTQLNSSVLHQSFQIISYFVTSIFTVFASCCFHFFCYIFLRDPYERLASAYTDKALRNNGLYLKTYNNPCDWFNMAYNTTLTFPQFVDCIIEKAERHSLLMSSRHSGIYLDQHWAPQSHLSLPCRANYTLIGKQDHFQDNTRFMVERLMLNVTLTRENSSSRHERSIEFWYNQLTS